jgi:hypothetical protein
VVDNVHRGGIVVSEEGLARLSPEELAAEAGTALPAKEVMSLLDLNANIDLALDTAAPIDLAVGANANIAAPINAAVDANVLSVGSESQAGAIQTGVIHQGIVGDATATADQSSSIAQGNPATTDPVPPPTDGGSGGATTGSITDGNLLNVDVNLDANLHLASPIDGAVAANANAAAPINAAASANIGTVDSSSVAVAQQDVAIDQGIQGDATATGSQLSGISQGDVGTAGDAGGATADAALPPADANGAPAADAGSNQP